MNFQETSHEPPEGVWTSEPTVLNGSGWSPLLNSKRRSGSLEEFMVIRPSRESAKGWTSRWISGASHSLSRLNEHGWALNVFWLPECREEGVGAVKAVQVSAAGIGLAPGSVYPALDPDG